MPPGQRYRSPGAVEADGDWSNAAFWLCAGALGKPVTVTGLRLDSPQGDRAVLDVLARFGARVEAAAGQATVSPGPLRGIAIDAGPIPDLIPDVYKRQVHGVLRPAFSPSPSAPCCVINA